MQLLASIASRLTPVRLAALTLSFVATLNFAPAFGEDKPAAKADATATAAAKVEAAADAHQVIDLWPSVAAGSENWKQTEFETKGGTNLFVRNVVKPTLTVYPADPATANGTAVVVCPGGGFYMLSWTHEGTDVAEWLAAHGVTAFVLKYRLTETVPEGEKPAADAPPKATRDEVAKLAGEDGRQAMRLVRQRAGEWKLDPNRIGVLGFSAGGYVTMSIVMEHDEASRPNFACPIYGGRTNGAAIPADAPPLFIVAASDDKIAPVCADLYKEWLAAGKSAELHLYAKGGHGFGTRKQNLPVDAWMDRLGEWMTQQGLLPKTDGPSK